MRKLTLLFALFCLALSIFPAAAQPLDELTALAAQFPAESPLFIAVRSDSGFIETIDGLLKQVNARFDGQLLGGSSLLESLNRDADRIQAGGTFESVYKSWLGDTIAVAAPTPEALMNPGGGIVAAVSITDQAAAEAFVDQLLADRIGYEKSTIDAGIFYAADSEWSTSYLLKEGVLLTTLSFPMEAEVLFSETRDSLADNPDFAAAMEALPLDDYNIAGYVNLPDLLAPAIAQIDAEAADTPLAELNIPGALEAIGTFSFGFTLLEGASLTADVHLAIRDRAALEAANLPIKELSPLNLDFTGRIPADAMLVIHDQGVGPGLLYGLTVLDQVGAFLDQNGINLGTAQRDPLAQDLLESFNVNDLATFFRLSFKGMTGLSIDEAVGWMSADFATYTRISPVRLLGVDNRLVLDSTSLIAITDADAAGRLMEALPPLMDQLNLKYDQDGGLLTLSLLENFPALMQLMERERRRMPFSLPLEIAVGMNEEVFAWGSREGVEFALNPTDGLNSTAVFQTASRAFLPDTQTLWYVALPPLREIARQMPEMDSRDGVQMMQALGIFDSASITAAAGEAGVSARFVLTLGR